MMPHVGASMRDYGLQRGLKCLWREQPPVPSRVWILREVFVAYVRRLLFDIVGVAIVEHVGRGYKDGRSGRARDLALGRPAASYVSNRGERHTVVDTSTQPLPPPVHAFG